MFILFSITDFGVPQALAPFAVTNCANLGTALDTLINLVNKKYMVKLHLRIVKSVMKKHIFKIPLITLIFKKYFC